MIRPNFSHGQLTYYQRQRESIGRIPSAILNSGRNLLISVVHIAVCLRIIRMTLS